MLFQVKNVIDIKENRLRELIRDMIKNLMINMDLDELSTTAMAPGYNTPYAFTGQKNKKKKRKRLKRITGELGWDIVRDDNESSDPMREFMGALNEYRPSNYDLYKNDNTMFFPIFGTPLGNMVI